MPSPFIPPRSPVGLLKPRAGRAHAALGPCGGRQQRLPLPAGQGPCRARRACLHRAHARRRCCGGGGGRSFGGVGGRRGGVRALARRGRLREPRPGAQPVCHAAYPCMPPLNSHPFIQSRHPMYKSKPDQPISQSASDVSSHAFIMSRRLGPLGLKEGLHRVQPTAACAYGWPCHASR